MARKPSGENLMSISTRLNPELMNKIDMYSNQTGIPKTRIFNDALNEYVKKLIEDGKLIIEETEEK